MVDDITLDILAGDWRIFQLRTGHRFSADDLLTAWTAVRTNPAARQVLDLGGSTDDYAWYIAMRRRSSGRQAGFGMGFERLVRYACGLERIADA